MIGSNGCVWFQWASYFVLCPEAERSPVAKSPIQSPLHPADFILTALRHTEKFTIDFFNYDEPRQTQDDSMQISRPQSRWAGVEAWTEITIVNTSRPILRNSYRQGRLHLGVRSLSLNMPVPHPCCRAINGVIPEVGACWINMFCPLFEC